MDHHSDTTLDELAGLFLTGEHSEHGEQSQHNQPDEPREQPPQPRTPPADPLGGPAPIKLPPKVAGAGPTPAGPLSAPASFGPSLGDEPDAHLLELLTGAVPVGSKTQATDGPAPTADLTAAPAADPTADPAPPAPSPALRWTGHDEVDLTNPPRRSEPARAVAEVVLMGNLPGMAGPWLTQYAQLLAQHQDGQHAVAVLHLDGDHLDLELIEPTVRRAGDDPHADPHADPSGDPAARAPGLRVPPGGFGDRDLIDLLDQLCRTGPTPVGTVLLHADPRHEGVQRLVDFPDWTLLSGADDAALAAATQLVRGLHDQDPRVADTRLGLMVMGSDAQASQHAADRVSRDLHDLLAAPPQLVGYQQQMIPARCRILGSFENIDAQWPRLIAWLGALQPPAAARTAEPPSAADDANAAGKSTPPRRQAPAARQPLPALDTPVQVAAAAPRTEPAQPAPTEPNLFALIDTDPRTTASIPGGVALEARCPSAPDAQLALDATGRLHLLLRHDSDAGDLPTPREAIVELVAVRTWARQHRQLLQLTERSRRFDPDADPVLHLFTDRADLSVDLVSRLGGLLKLHLLRDVAVGNQHTWFCVPLSA